MILQNAVLAAGQGACVVVGDEKGLVVGRKGDVMIYLSRGATEHGALHVRVFVESVMRLALLYNEVRRECLDQVESR